MDADKALESLSLELKKLAQAPTDLQKQLIAETPTDVLVLAVLKAIEEPFNNASEETRNEFIQKLNDLENILDKQLEEVNAKKQLAHLECEMEELKLANKLEQQKRETEKLYAKLEGYKND